MLTDRLADAFIGLATGRQWDRMKDAFSDIARISDRASPGGAMRMMRHATDPDDLATFASFVERHPTGAFAMHITGEAGASTLRTSARASRAAANAASGTGLAAERTLIAAARKGPAGAKLLTTPIGRAMLRPHPLVGVLKAVYKGNAETLVTRLMDRLGPSAWWLLPLAWAWLFVEVAMLLPRLAWFKPRDPAAKISSAPRRAA
jgi:hypothetical protein